MRTNRRASTMGRAHERTPGRGGEAGVLACRARPVPCYGLGLAGRGGHSRRPVSAALLVALVSGAVALVTAIATAFLGARQTRLKSELDKQQARQDLMSRIRDPGLLAAFDLQSRIYNVGAQQFLVAYLRDGSDDDRAYALKNTLFVFAQYLAWMEIVRRKVQFLDIGTDERNLQIVNAFWRIGGILSSDGYSDDLLRIFRGNQRALGEIMIVSRPDSELDVIGYAEFVHRLDTDQSFAVWFGRLTRDICQLSDRPRHPCTRRLVDLQGALIDLIDLLDEGHRRFPDQFRSRLSSLPGIAAG